MGGSLSQPMVRLLDGQQVPADSEAWRHECEARMVARLPTTAQRHEYVDTVRRKRGDAAARALRDLAADIRLREVLGRPAER